MELYWGDGVDDDYDDGDDDDYDHNPQYICTLTRARRIIVSCWVSFFITIIIGLFIIIIIGLFIIITIGLFIIIIIGLFFIIIIVIITNGVKAAKIRINALMMLTYMYQLDSSSSSSQWW